MTFASSGRRDAYLKGPPVVPGGWDVVGRTWLVHVDGLVEAQAVQARVRGVVRKARAT